MTEIDLNASNIVDHLKNGATFHRHEDIVELNVPDTGSVRVPVPVFDSLVEQHQIEKCPGGFYKLAGTEAS
jgi:hypothetical protein